MRHGGKILVDQLEAQGVSVVFTVPGESFLAALDGLHDTNRIQTVICRQEGGASMMAEAHGKLTGKPGICMVTRGPGLANAMSGLHVAQQDSTPMILFVGLPGAGFEDREAFQEIELKDVLRSYVKWAAVIRDIKRLPEYVSRAFHVAQSGRPGPVVLGLPEDMLSDFAEVIDARPASLPDPAPGSGQITALSELLARAERPLLIVGGPGWSADIKTRMETFAKRLGLPIACAFRFQDYIDNRHPCYVGHVGIGIEAKLAEAVKSADLLIVVGARLGEMTTSGYTLISSPNPSQFLVHVHPSPDELGTVYRPDISISASAQRFAEALSGIEIAGAREGGVAKWAPFLAGLREAYEATHVLLQTPGNVRMEEIVRTVDELLPANGIVTNGAGNYTTFVHRYFRYKSWRSGLAPTSGSMGYGLPAAIAAKQAEPQRPVVCFAGDGCFMMTSQELATAVQYGLPIIIIVANNGGYGTIRMHQEKHYPGRTVATTLVNPDFAAFAKSFGAYGETVTATEDFRSLFQRALMADRPFLIELKTDIEAITPKTTLTAVRQAAEQGR